MDADLALKGKYTFRVDGQKLILVKKPVESLRHVVMKALLWALYLPHYPQLQVEVSIGNKYKPDLVHTASTGPVFWGEAGTVSTAKLRRILKRFPQTHFALAIWNGSLAPLASRVRRQSDGLARRAPVDIIRFPNDADRQFIDDGSNIHIRHRDVEWQRLGESEGTLYL